MAPLRRLQRPARPPGTQAVCSPGPGPRQLGGCSPPARRWPGPFSALAPAGLGGARPSRGGVSPPSALCRALCPLGPGPARVRPGGCSPPLPGLGPRGRPGPLSGPPLCRPCPRRVPALRPAALRCPGAPGRARSAGASPPAPPAGGPQGRFGGGAASAPRAALRPPRRKGEIIHTCYTHAHVCIF